MAAEPALSGQHRRRGSTGLHAGASHDRPPALRTNLVIRLQWRATMVAEHWCASCVPALLWGEYAKQASKVSLDFPKVTLGRIWLSWLSLVPAWSQSWPRYL